MTFVFTVALVLANYGCRPSPGSRWISSAVLRNELVLVEYDGGRYAIMDSNKDLGVVPSAEYLGWSVDEIAIVNGHVFGRISEPLGPGRRYFTINIDGDVKAVDSEEALDREAAAIGLPAPVLIRSSDFIASS